MEVPVLVLIALLVVDDLLAGAHYAVLAEVEVGYLAFADVDNLLAGLHFTLGVERIFLGIDGEQLQAALCVVGLAVLEIEPVGLPLLADSLNALDVSPVGGAFSVLVVILVACHAVVRGSCLGGAGSLRYRKLVPAGLHTAVLEGVVCAVNLFIDLVFHAFAAAVIVEPGLSVIGIFVFILKLDPAGLHLAVAFFAQVIVEAVKAEFAGHHVAVLIEVVGASLDGQPAGCGHFSVFSVIVPVIFRLALIVAVIFVFHGDPALGDALSVFSYVILIYLRIDCLHSLGIQIEPVVASLFPGIRQQIAVGIVEHPTPIFLSPACACSVYAGYGSVG